MATGTMMRHSTDPSARITVTSGGSAIDLTDFSIKFVFWWSTTLSLAIASTADTFIVLPTASYGIVETSDIAIINHERMLITTTPTTEPASTAHFTVTRGYTIPATSATVYASTVVSGTGDNVFVLGSSASLSLTVDGGADKLITLASAGTSTNYLMSHLVTDMFAAIDSVVSNTAVSNVANRLYLTSDATGTGSSLVISGVDAITTAQLGWANTTDYGEAAVTCSKAKHSAADTVKIIKFERAGRIVTAASGIAEYEWRSGDTNRAGTFYCTFEFRTDEGRVFQIPNDDSYTLEVVADPNDRLIAEGE